MEYKEVAGPLGDGAQWETGNYGMLTFSPSLFASGPGEQLAPAQAPPEMVIFLIVCTIYLIKAKKKAQERRAHIGSGSEATVHHSGEGVQP